MSVMQQLLRYESTPICIACAAPTTPRVDGQRYQSCGWHMRQREIEYGADAPMPRDKDGRPVGTASKARAAHRESLVCRLEGQVSLALIRQRFGMDYSDAFTEFPHSVIEMMHSDRRVQEALADV